jgi:hypothetical protein
MDYIPSDQIQALSEAVKEYASALPEKVKEVLGPDIVSGAITTAGFTAQLVALSQLPFPYNIYASTITAMLSSGLKQTYEAKRAKIEPEKQTVENTPLRAIQISPQPEKKEIADAGSYFKGFEFPDHVLMYGPTNSGKSTRLALYLEREIMKELGFSDSTTHTDSYFDKIDSYYIIAPHKPKALDGYKQAIAFKNLKENGNTQPELYYYPNDIGNYDMMITHIKKSENQSKRKLLIIEDLETNKRLQQKVTSDLTSIRGWNCQVVAILHNFLDTLNMRNQSKYIILNNTPEKLFKQIFQNYYTDKSKIHTMWMEYVTLNNAKATHIYNRVLIFDTTSLKCYLGFGKGLEFQPLIPTNNMNDKL